MVMEIDGVAIVPDFYISEDESVIRIRSEDIDSAIENTSRSNFVNKHKDESADDVRGIVTKLSRNSTNGMTYKAMIVDEEVESNIKSIFNDGKVPNVSAFMKPSDDATVTTVVDESTGVSYNIIDKWTIPHISLVDVGRCKPEDGCGVFNYSIYNSEQPIGDKMTDLEELSKILDARIAEVTTLSAERDSIAIKLSDISEKNIALENDVEALKADKEAAILKLAEIEDSKKAEELSKLREQILVLDDTIEIKDEQSVESLQLVLDVLRHKSTAPRGGGRRDNNDEVPESVTLMKELKLRTGRK